MHQRREIFWERTGRWSLLLGFAFFAGFYAFALRTMGPTTPAFHFGYSGFAALTMLPLALYQMKRAKSRLLFFGLLFACLTLTALLPTSAAEYEMHRLRPGMTAREAESALRHWDRVTWSGEAEAARDGGYESATYVPADTPRINFVVLRFEGGYLTDHQIGWD